MLKPAITILFLVGVAVVAHGTHVDSSLETAVGIFMMAFGQAPTWNIK